MFHIFSVKVVEHLVRFLPKIDDNGNECVTFNILAYVYVSTYALDSSYVRLN